MTTDKLQPGDRVRVTAEMFGKKYSDVTGTVIYVDPYSRWFPVAVKLDVTQDGHDMYRFHFLELEKI